MIRVWKKLDVQIEGKLVHHSRKEVRQGVDLEALQLKLPVVRRLLDNIQWDLSLARTQERAICISSPGLIMHLCQTLWDCYQVHVYTGFGAVIALTEILTSHFLQSHVLWRPCIERILIFICSFGDPCIASARDDAALNLCPGTCDIKSSLYTITRIIENGGLCSLDPIEWCCCLHVICVSLWRVIYTSLTRIHNVAVQLGYTMLLSWLFHWNKTPSVTTGILVTLSCQTYKRIRKVCCATALANHDLRT